MAQELLVDPEPAVEFFSMHTTLFPDFATLHIQIVGPFDPSGRCSRLQSIIDGLKGCKGNGLVQGKPNVCMQRQLRRRVWLPIDCQSPSQVQSFAVLPTGPALSFAAELVVRRENSNVTRRGSFQPFNG